MPATPSRIGFILQEYRVVKSEDAAVLADYGDAARKTDLVPTFFETEADAQAMCSERHDLLSEDRRWFQQTVSGIETALALTYTSTPPAVNVIDDERAADHDGLVTEIGIDFVNNTTIIESWG